MQFMLKYHFKTYSIIEKNTLILHTKHSLLILYLIAVQLAETF